MNNKKYILFDLDGTITDSGPGIMNAAQYALKSMGMEEKDPDRLRLFVGPPLDKSFMGRYGMDMEQALVAIAKFREYYNETGIFENSVYEGIEPLLATLKEKGYVLAIASSKPQVMIHIVLEHFSIKKYFDVIVGCELDGRRSDKKEVVEEVLRQLSEIPDQDGYVPVSKEDLISRSVMVGDRCYDVTGSHEFGLECIGILYGYGTREEMEKAGADYIADTAKDLEKLLIG